jgi:hypothetical protein
MILGMSKRAMVRTSRGDSFRGAIGGAALLFLIPACGGAGTPSVAVGKVGSDLSAHTHAVPQGAEVCALQEAVAAPATGTEKPTSETCGKALKSDQLWRRSMGVLAAYAETLEDLAAGGNSESTGQLAAARTGVTGPNWIEVEDGKEKAARTAAADIVNQLGTNTSKGDLDKMVKDAAPHVKTVCEGLVAYLEAQARGLVDVQKEVEKKRTARNDRRCASVDSRSICVGESVIDRMVYANMFGHAAALESSHLEAHDAVAGFCAAHAKLQEAAEKGDLSSDKTYVNVVDAVKSARRSQPQVGAEGGGKAAPEPPATPSGKPGAPPPKK